MSKLVQEMEPIAVPKHVKDDLDASLKQAYTLNFVEVSVRPQWLPLQGNPLLSFATGIL